MVFVLMFRSLLPLLNASVLDALIMGCTWFLARIGLFATKPWKQI